MIGMKKRKDPHKPKLEKKNTALEMPINRKHMAKKVKGNKAAGVLFTKELGKTMSPFQKEFKRINDMDTLDYQREQRRDPKIIEQEIVSKEAEWKNMTYDTAKRDSIRAEILLLQDELHAPDAEDHQKMVDDFNRWLVGRGNEEDVALTPWGRTPLTREHPTISSYLGGMMDKRMDFLAEVARLKETIQMEPITLDRAYLYFKYIVRGKMNDPATLGYLSEIDTMFGRVTREEKEAYGMSNEKSVELEGYYNGNESVTNDTLVKKEFIPGMISEFATLMKSRELQSLTTGAMAENPEYTKQESTIREQRIRRNKLASELTAYRAERKDVNALLSKYEKDNRTHQTDFLYSLVRQRAEDAKRMNKISARLEGIRESKLSSTLSPAEQSEVQGEYDSIEARISQYDAQIKDITADNEHIGKEDWDALDKFHNELLASDNDKSVAVQTAEKVSRVMRDYVLGRKVDPADMELVYNKVENGLSMENKPVYTIQSTLFKESSRNTLSELLIGRNEERYERLEQLNRRYIREDVDNALVKVTPAALKEQGDKRGKEVRALYDKWFSEDRSSLNLPERQRIESALFIGEDEDLLALTSKHIQENESQLNSERIVEAIQQGDELREAQLYNYQQKINNPDAKDQPISKKTSKILAKKRAEITGKVKKSLSTYRKGVTSRISTINSMLSKVYKIRKGPVNSVTYNEIKSYAVTLRKSSDETRAFIEREKNAIKHEAAALAKEYNEALKRIIENEDPGQNENSMIEEKDNDNKDEIADDNLFY